MSDRTPSGPRPTRRDLFRALALSVPAASLACTGGQAIPTSSPTSSTPVDPPTDTGSGPTFTGPDDEPRNPLPGSDWPGLGAADLAAFPLGMQTGDPLPDGLVVWVYAPGAAEVVMHRARFDGSGWVVDGSDTVAPSTAGYAHLDLTGLDPDTSYAFQAEAGGAFSSVVHGRTAVGDVYTEVRIGACSCLDQLHGEFPCLDEVQGLGPMDAFLWLGDTIYADDRFTVEGYRALWQEQLSKGTFQRLLARVPGVFTWDDHEVANNWSPQDIDPARFAMAVDTFHETLPLPASVRSTGRLWRSLRFGKTVEVFVLDVRSERDAAVGHYVSPEQLAWLMDGLSASSAVWKLVATSVPMTDWPELWDALGVQVDRWDGFPGTQRAELLAHIRDEGLTGVLFVAGDLHQTTLGYVDPPGGVGDELLEVLAGPGGSFRNTAARLVEEEGQFRYMDAEWSALRMTFHANGTARLETINEDGVLLFDATVDVRGGVAFDAVAHPYLDE